MSDVGKYDSIVAEVLSKIGNPTGSMSVDSSLSLDDLCMRDGIRKPAIGVMIAGAKKDAPRALGQSDFYATLLVQVMIVDKNLRGAKQSRTVIYNLLERVRDALHYQKSSYAPGRYLWMAEEWPDQLYEDTVAAIATYELQVILGVQ